MSSLAGALASAVFGAMRPTHERSAGDWQAEWQAVPEIAVLAGSSLHHAVDVVRGLRVFPEAMAANLAADGGLVIAEAYMMRLAPLLGREASHNLVYDASKECRLTGATLFEVLRRKLPLDAADAVTVLGKEIVAADYLGDVEVTCEVAVARWRSLPRPECEHELGPRATNHDQ
jgi:3-carboxy-cis,cis-muconate cycloisomerase